MSETQTTETTERKPPTIADIVRQKTDGGAIIIDFFTDVMTGRVEGAELCHRIDAAKQLVKYGHKGAAEFLDKNRGIPCGHSTGGRPGSDDPCTDDEEERTPVIVDLIAPAALTREFLTVLSGVDEFLMRQLIRAQTADGNTIVEFLDDVMHGREPTFRTHHRLAAAKELIAHILRDEQTSVVPAQAGTQRSGADEGLPTPSPSTGEGLGEGEGAGERLDSSPSPSMGEGWGEGDSSPSPSTGKGWDEGDSSPSPLTGEGWGEGEGAGDDSAEPEHTTVVPAKAGTHPQSPSQPETKSQQPKTRPRLPRRLRRQLGDARARRRREAPPGRSPP